jgi:hypothetical protein
MFPARELSSPTHDLSVTASSTNKVAVRNAPAFLNAFSFSTKIYKAVFFNSSFCCTLNE